MSDVLIDDIISYLGDADHVIENGTSGNWKYRKWQSGKIEAWYAGDITGSRTTSSGSLHYCTFSTSIPNVIGFTSKPNIVAFEDYNAATVCGMVATANSTATTVSGKIWRVTSSTSTTTVYLRIYAWQN